MKMFSYYQRSVASMFHWNVQQRLETQCAAWPKKALWMS